MRPNVQNIIMLQRIIVNAKIYDDITAAALMKHLLENYFEDADFPEAAKQIKHYKHSEEGGKR